tara:strand:+ start:141 stop:662 length:522 start_codon:yes stop_codon:yes gene_type:complete
MTKDFKQVNTKEKILYKNLLLLSRNTLFYTKFDLEDSFQNRIHLIFIHTSFLFIKIKQDAEISPYKVFYQKMFDFIFVKIEENMREIGYGDVNVNKNMKILVKNFYNILLTCEKYGKFDSESKKMFFLKYLKLKGVKKHSISDHLIDYFNKYEAFCFDLSSDSVLSGELNFNY